MSVAIHTLGGLLTLGETERAAQGPPCDRCDKPSNVQVDELDLCLDCLAYLVHMGQ